MSQILHRDWQVSLCLRNAKDGNINSASKVTGVSVLLCWPHENKQWYPMQGSATVTFSECDWSNSARCFLTSESSTCRRDTSNNEYWKLPCDNQWGLASKPVSQEMITSKNKKGSNGNQLIESTLLNPLSVFYDLQEHIAMLFCIAKVCPSAVEGK